MEPCWNFEKKKMHTARKLFILKWFYYIFLKFVNSKYFISFKRMLHGGVSMKLMSLIRKHI